MKKIITALMAVILTMLCGCGEKETVPDVTEKSEETTKATASPYILVRGWEGRELLDSIYYCGEYRPLPMMLDDSPDISFSGDILRFPDGTYAEGYADENGCVYAVRFRSGSAPSDLNIYGISFRSKPDDIPVLIGAANSISGDMDDIIYYHFYEGGITELTFVFEKRALKEIYISA